MLCDNNRLNLLMYFLRLLIDIVLYIIYANQVSINSMMISIIYYVYVPLRLVHSNDLNQHTCGLITSLTQRRSLLLLCSKLKEKHSLFPISCHLMFFFSKLLQLEEASIHLLLINVPKSIPIRLLCCIIMTVHLLPS